MEVKMLKMVSKLRDRVESQKVTQPSKLSARVQPATKGLAEWREYKQKLKIYRKQLARQRHLEGLHGEQEEAYGAYARELEEYTEAINLWESPEKREKERKDVEEAFLLLEKKTDIFAEAIGESSPGYKEVLKFKTNVQTEQERLFDIETETKQKEEQARAEWEAEQYKPYAAAISQKPLGVGITEGEYYTALNQWIERHKDVLATRYEQTISIIEDDPLLTPEQKERVELFQPEVEKFQTYKGAADYFSKKLFSKSPKYSQIYLRGAGLISIPYFEGKYEVLDPSTGTITEKESIVTRYSSRGMAMTKEETLGTRKIGYSDPIVRAKLFPFKPETAWKGSFSRDIAGRQKEQIIAKLEKEQIEKGQSIKFIWENPYVGKGGFVSQRGQVGHFTFKPTKAIKPKKTQRLSSITW